MGVSYVGLIVGLGVFLALMAMILRAAVAVANRILPKNDLPAEEQAVALDEDASIGSHDTDRPRDLSNPFSPPETENELPLPSVAIPTPGLGRACLTVFAQTIVLGGFSVLLSLGLDYQVDRNGMILGSTLVLHFLLAALILKLILPTTFVRGLLVSVFQLVLAFSVCFAIVAIVSSAINY